MAVLVLAGWEFRELVRDPGGDLVTAPLLPEAGTPAGEGTRRRWSAALPALLVPWPVPS